MILNKKNNFKDEHWQSSAAEVCRWYWAKLSQYVQKSDCFFRSLTSCNTEKKVSLPGVSILYAVICSTTPIKWSSFLTVNIMENQRVNTDVDRSIIGNYEALVIKNVVKIERKFFDGVLVYLPNLSIPLKISKAEIIYFSLMPMNWYSIMEDFKHSFKVRSEYLTIQSTCHQHWEKWTR